MAPFAMLCYVAFGVRYSPCTPKAKLHLEYAYLYVFVPHMLSCIWSTLLSVNPKSQVSFGVR